MLLHDILCKDYSSMLGLLCTTEAKGAFDKMCEVILDYLCLQQYNHCKLLILCMDFSAKGFAMLHANWRTTTYHFKPCLNACKAAALTS
jgi:hypothetical protein